MRRNKTYMKLGMFLLPAFAVMLTFAGYHHQLNSKPDCGFDCPVIEDVFAERNKSNALKIKKLISILRTELNDSTPAATSEIGRLRSLPSDLDLKLFNEKISALNSEYNSLPNLNSEESITQWKMSASKLNQEVEGFLNRIDKISLDQEQNVAFSNDSFTGYLVGLSNEQGKGKNKAGRFSASKKYAFKNGKYTAISNDADGLISRVIADANVRTASISNVFNGVFGNGNFSGLSNLSTAPYIIAASTLTTTPTTPGGIAANEVPLPPSVTMMMLALFLYASYRFKANQLPNARISI